MDLYRLDSTAEMEDIGVVDYLMAMANVIEWAEKLRKLKPECAIEVSLSRMGKKPSRDPN